MALALPTEVVSIWSKPQESHETVQLADTVLQRSSTETPAIPAGICDLASATVVHIFDETRLA